MKREELKDYSILDIEAIDDERYKKEKAPGKWVPETRVYQKEDVDAVIAQLKAENERLKATPEQIMKEIFDKVLIYPNELVSLDDAYKLAVETKQAKRALWLARADRAMMTLDYFTLKCRWFKDYMKVEPPECDVKMIHKWATVERKCRAKAKEYK